MLAKYLIRKLVYTVVTAGLFGAYGYLSDKTAIEEWTTRGLAGAAVAGAVGAILSAPMGGALSKDR